MNQTIRNRINQIKNGQVPEGYEKTSFGIFPVDWEKKKRLKSLGDFSKGKGLPGTALINEGVPCVGYGDIYMKYNYHFNKAKSFVDKDTAKESQAIEKGTLLFTGTGETALEIGKCICYNGDEIIYAGGDILLFNSNSVNPLFLAYQQNIEFAIKQKAKYGQGHSVVHIQRNNLEKLNVAYPKSQTEQAKIAEILMKWDEAIEAQEQLIQKLEIRKKALMQKLLTPKEGWKNCKLKDICIITTGKLDANAMVEDGKYIFFTCSKEIYKIDKFAFDCEALLIAGNGDIGDIKYYKGKFNAYQRTYVLYDFKFNIHYTMQYLLKHFNKEVMKGMQKSSMPYIKLGLLQNAKIYYKGDILEKVERILSLADTEIELHKQQLEQLTKQRKSLMQLLLTGIVRTV
ncbi:MAG: restriction endonuclease subunit S [Candidatus Cloacimonetes bacterium]|nr:restriction endonuclease subunit S [Candidatus Cloacimonadota bacterium]